MNHLGEISGQTHRVGLQNSQGRKTIGLDCKTLVLFLRLWWGWGVPDSVTPSTPVCNLTWQKQSRSLCCRFSYYKTIYIC